MHVDLVDRFVTKMPAADLRFFSIATLLDPTMKNWGWPGCRRDKAFAEQVFLSEFDANWAPPSAPDAPAADGPLASTAAAPAFMQGLDFLLPAQAPSLPPPLAPGPEMPAAELSEAQKYLETKFAVTFVSGKDILDFWRMHEKEYPYLAKMARQYLGCPASSASVERIFSVTVAGQFFNDLRRKLDDKKLEELMWAAINKGNRRKE